MMVGYPLFVKLLGQFVCHVILTNPTQKITLLRARNPAPLLNPTCVPRLCSRSSRERAARATASTARMDHRSAHTSNPSSTIVVAALLLLLVLLMLLLLQVLWHCFMLCVECAMNDVCC